MLELHVWGSAFGLPSIDAECLATIAYLSLALPPQQKTGSEGTGADEWVVIPDAETAAVPTDELPALYTPSGRWISGFRNIVQYLRQYSNGRCDLDSWMNDWEKANCIAFSSFLTNRASPLLDLSLYVSSENYDNATRKALTQTLSCWPNTWLVPPRLREHAKLRTKHLGLNSLDLDDRLSKDRKDTREAMAESQIPESLKSTPRENISNLLAQGKTVSPARIKLDTMVGELVGPLADLLSSPQPKRYMLGSPSSLDCLALGYLSLATVPDLPYSWLRDAVAQQAPQLLAYVNQMRGLCFGEQPYTMNSIRSSAEAGSPPQTELQRDAGVGQVTKIPLCRGTPAPAIRTVASAVLDSMLDSIPFIPSTWRMRPSTIQQQRPEKRARREKSEDASSDDEDEEDDAETSGAVAQMCRRERLVTLGTVLLGGVAFVGYLFSTGIVSASGDGDEEEYEEEEEGAGKFGQAGELLGL